MIVVFRDRDELRPLLDSIVPFKTPGLEIVVIDGASTDGTVELLQSYKDIDYWVSEPDTGIYNAMNKGLAAAHGTYILHLNAGDRLLNVPWDDLRQCSADNIDVVCCRVLLEGRIEFISRTSLLSRIDNTWHHQGTFYRRVAHLGYDETYRTHADFDHNQRLLKRNCTIRQLPAIVANHDLKGVTSTQDARHLEVYRSVRANFGWGFLQLSRLRFFLRSIRDLARGRKGN